MTIHRIWDSRRSWRAAVVFGAFVTALAAGPEVAASVQVGVSVHLDLPQGVHLTVGNYDPYYVGRVFYEPLGVWRPVYSFPVETPYGVFYEPFVYDGRHVVCREYIPGPEAGYARFVLEGRGHYESQWYRGPSEHRHRDHDRGHGHHGGQHHGNEHDDRD